MKLTPEQIMHLFDKVSRWVDDYESYHTWYMVSCDPYWNSDKTSLSFTVTGHSDQGEGADWEENWAIDCDGKIYDSQTVHNSFEDFKNNW